MLFRDVETAAWAKAEFCMVRGIVNLLTRDPDALSRWTQVPAPRDASQLWSKYHLLAFLAKQVHQTSMA